MSAPLPATASVPDAELLALMAALLAAWAGVTRAERVVMPGSAEQLDRETSLRLVEQALQRLAPKKREVFVLVTVEGFRGDEVASALGIPVKTVWTRLHHARRELRAALPQEDP